MGLLDSRYRPEFNEGESKRVDWFLFFVVLALAVLGTINLYSATFDTTLQQSPFLLRQLFFFGTGFLIIALFLLFDYRLLEHFSYFIYATNILLVLGTQFFGVTRGGQRLWYDFGFMSFQPSETMKLAMILALAKYFHGKEYAESLGLRELFMPLLIVGAGVGAILLQPDQGTALVVMLIGVSVILFFGIKKRILLTTFIAGLILSPIVWNFVFEQRHRDRIMVVFNPNFDPRGKGYNSLQSMIAVGSGEFSGKGFKQGTQTQLGFTPERHTDFIFTVLAEEWGWLGATLCLLLYVILIYRCVWAASHAREKFGAIVALGVASMLMFHVLINTAMVIGLFPIVGIPLPLMSYGGSSAIGTSMAIGLVLNIGYRRIMF